MKSRWERCSSPEIFRISASSTEVIDSDLVEFPRHQIPCSPSEELIVRLGHLHDDHRLLGRDAAVLHDLALHLAGLLVIDLHIGVSDTAEDVGKERDISGLIGIETVESFDDLPYGSDRRVITPFPDLSDFSVTTAPTRSQPVQYPHDLKPPLPRLRQCRSIRSRSLQRSAPPGLRSPCSLPAPQPSRSWPAYSGCAR